MADRCASCHRRLHRQRGLTLVECLIASACLLAAVTAFSLAINASSSQGAYGLHAQQAIRLADELMERILAKPYLDAGGNQTPGPESGETGPANFDNIDDFHGYNEPAGQLKDVAGALLPGEYQRFSRDVTAVYGNETVAGLGGTVPGLTVTVTVWDRDGQSWSIRRFVPRYFNQTGS